MATPSSAPVGPSGRPAPRLPGPPPPHRGQFRPPAQPNPGFGPPRRPNRPALTEAQQIRLLLICSIAVVLGALGGLVATLVLPRVYVAQTTVHYSLSQSAAVSDDADRALTTQTVLITSRQVLQPVANSTNVPIDYLASNVTATVLPGSEIIQIEVRHPDRTSGVALADAIAKRYLNVANASDDLPQVQTQLNNATRQLSTPGNSPGTVTDLQNQVSDLQSQLTQLADTNNIASIVAPGFSVPQAVFPNTVATLGIGVLLGTAIAALIATNMVRRWTQR
jgi:capsular polysaccharide biosynthesis protein